MSLLLSKNASIQILEDLIDEVFGREAGSAPDIYKMDYDDLCALEKQSRAAIFSLRNAGGTE